MNIQINYSTIQITLCCIQTYYSKASRETKKRKIQRVNFTTLSVHNNMYENEFACVYDDDVRQFLCQQMNFLLSISKLLFAAIILFDE